MKRIEKEYHNFRFCDDSRTILYDILYRKPHYIWDRITNQRTPQLTHKEYFKRKLMGK